MKPYKPRLFWLQSKAAAVGRSPGWESVRNGYFVTNWNGLGTKHTALILTSSIVLLDLIMLHVTFNIVTSFSLSIGLGLGLSFLMCDSRMIPAGTTKLGIRKLLGHIIV